MSRFWTAALCVLAFAAVVFLAIYEPLTRSTRESAAAARDGFVLSLDASKVNEIRISASDEAIVLKRRGGGWQLGSKSKDRADSALVERVLQAAAGLTFYDRIDGREFPSDKDWSDYGLRTPKRKIEFEGGGKRTIFFGKDAANESRLYVRTSESRSVYLVGDELLSLAFRDAADFRDRRLTDLTPDRIDRFIIRRPGGEMELLRDAGGWRLVKPVHAAADSVKVEEFLKRVLGLRILEYAADDSGDLGAYGIAEGQNEVSLFADGSERHQTLRLGIDPAGTLFGQFTARDSVYRMPAGTMEILQTTPDALRDRKLLPLNLDIVDLIRIRAPGREFAIRRNGEGWELQDGDARRPASAAAVRALVDAVSTAEVTAYAPLIGENLAQCGFDAPVCSVDFLSVLSENTPEARAGEQVITGLTFGKTVDGHIFVRVGDAPEAASVPEAILHAVPSDPGLWAAPK